MLTVRRFLLDTNCHRLLARQRIKMADIFAYQLTRTYMILLSLFFLRLDIGYLRRTKNVEKKSFKNCLQALQYPVIAQAPQSCWLKGTKEALKGSHYEIFVQVVPPPFCYPKRTRPQEEGYL